MRAASEGAAGFAAADGAAGFGAACGAGWASAALAVRPKMKTALLRIFMTHPFQMALRYQVRSMYENYACALPASDRTPAGDKILPLGADRQRRAGTVSHWH